MAKQSDKFTQFLYLSVDQAATNTIAFSQLSLGLSFFDYAGLIITRIEYDVALGALTYLTANADELFVGLTGSDSIDDLTPNRPEVYDLMRLKVLVSGTPATAGWMKFPIVHDFSAHPGGGILVPAQDLYLGIDSAGFGNYTNVSASARVWYMVTKLAAADYLEIAQRLRVLSTG